MNHPALKLLTYTALSPTTPGSQGAEDVTYLVLLAADRPPSTGQGFLYVVAGRNQWLMSVCGRLILVNSDPGKKKCKVTSYLAITRKKIEVAITGMTVLV